MTTYSKNTGFTLLEVLIALIIVATASAIILTHIRTMMDMNIRLRQQQDEVTQLLNRVAQFPLSDFNRMRTKTSRNTVQIYTNNGKKIVTVKNYIDGQNNPPPINKIYTAYQHYIFNTAHQQITLLLPGMRYNP